MQDLHNTISPEAEHIKAPILVPLCIVIFILLAVSLFALTYIQKLNIEKEVQAHVTGIHQLFTIIERQEAELIGSLLQNYEKDREIQQAFLAGDRARLFKATEPVFAKLNEQYDITHFYFFGLDKTCFLRVHNAGRFGDVIDRYTLNMAAGEKRTASGIELGPYGTLTLRIVLPWIIDGQLVGYVEMGKEIEHIIHTIKETLNVEIFNIVNIRHLDRQRWEEGLQMLGRTGIWEEFPRHVVLDRTMRNVPKALNQYIQLPHDEKEGLLFDVPMGDKNYKGGFIPLKEVSGKEIGEIIFLRDYTDTMHSFRFLTLAILLVSSLLALTLFTLFYILIDKMEQRLVHSHQNLNEEIAERTKAEQQIKASLEEKELLLREIHHRVKNNMQIVASLFRLQQRQLEDPKLIEILTESQNRINAMALVHDSLYQPQSLSTIDLRQYIKQLGRNLFQTYGLDPQNIEFVDKIEQINIDIDTAIPCGLIINELLTNSIKHAFPDGRKGAILLILKQDSDSQQYQLQFSDNGVGMSEDIDIHQTKSLGMQLVVNLIEHQLHGTIDVDRQEGTEYLITFKGASNWDRI